MHPAQTQPKIPEAAYQAKLAALAVGTFAEAVESYIHVARMVAPEATARTTGLLLHHAERLGRQAQRLELEGLAAAGAIAGKLAAFAKELS